MLSRLPKALLNLSAAVPFIVALLNPYLNQDFIENGAIVFVLLELVSFTVTYEFTREKRAFGKILLINLLILSLVPVFYMRQFWLIGTYYVLNIIYTLSTSKEVKVISQYFLQFSLGLSNSLLIIIVFQDLLVKAFPIYPVMQNERSIFVYYGPLFAIQMFFFELFNWPNKNKILRKR